MKSLPNWQSRIDDFAAFSRVRLVALDIDGTLIHASDAEIGHRLRALRNALQTTSQRVKITVATGRAFASAAPVIERLNPDLDVPAITYNGSVIVVPSDRRVLYHRSFDRITIEAVTSTATALGAAVLLYSIGSLQLMSHPDPIREKVYGFGASVNGPTFDFNKLPITWLTTPKELPPDEFVAMLLIDEDWDRLSRANDAVRETSGVSVTSSGSRFVEIRPKGSNKAAALRILGEELGISRNEILALGDNDNDVEMLDWAGIGVAVESGSAAALAAADYTCRYGPVKAAIEVLRCIKSARRYSRSQTH